MAAVSHMALETKGFGTVTVNVANDTGSSGSFTYVDRTTQVLNGATVSKIGVFSNTARSYTLKIAKRNSANNYDFSVSQVYSHGGTGWEDMTISSPFAVPASGTYFVAGFTGSTPSATIDRTAAVARAFVSGDATGLGVTTSGEDTSVVMPLRYTYSF